jgi:hypothetical protein
MEPVPLSKDNRTSVFCCPNIKELTKATKTVFEVYYGTKDLTRTT